MPDWIGSHVRSFSYMGSVRPIGGPDNIKSNVARFGKTTTLRNAGAVVESFFSLLSRRKLKRGVHRSTLALEKDIRGFLDGHNDDPAPYVWTKTADQILGSLQRYCDDIAGE